MKGGKRVMISAIILFLLGLLVGGFLGGWQWESISALRGDKEKQGSNNAVIDNDLLSVYTTGTLSDEGFTSLGLSDDQRFSLLQYCGHDQKYCQDAWTQGMDEEMIILMFGAIDYYRLPFVGSLDESDTLSRLGIGCAETDEVVDQLHDEFYATPPQSLGDVFDVGIDLGLGFDFSECISNGSPLVYIAQSMQKAIQYFDISKTPSYVLIDNRSKYRALIPGLYSLGEVGEVMTREFDFEGLE